MSTVAGLTALEILDSRGRPTVSATCRLSSGASASASVPSGASTGRAESCELRDGDSKRYHGLGCRSAVANINGDIAAKLVGSNYADQSELDSTLIDLDGEPNKARLGSNALLAVSIAFARAVAAENHVPLYKHFASLLGQDTGTLPRLTINLLSGGKHAGRQVAIQDVLIVPISTRSLDESLAMAFDIYQAAASLVERRYGLRLLRADEGGLAPPTETAEAMIQTAVDAIEAAGYRPAHQVAVAIDVASSHFFTNGYYHLDGDVLNSNEMIARVKRWVNQFPIVSVEDALAEDDWQHWPGLREAIADRALVVGDDLLCTNPTRIRRAIATEACNTLLLKVNQIGTLSEALSAVRSARSGGWQVTASARSGETEDNWLADIAAGWSADQVKVGSITQSERLAKYNRLLAIESEAARRLVPFRVGSTKRSI